MKNSTENKTSEHIAIIYSVPTKRARATPFAATDEDTKASALEVAGAVRAKGAQAELVEITEDTIDRIRSVKADCVFNLIEWDGLDAQLSLKAFGYIEDLKIPFTGATKENFALIADKVKMKEALDLADIPTPRWQLFTTGDEPVRRDFHFPVIAKLALEHCSVGLTRDAVVSDKALLSGVVKERIHTFRQPVYVEEFIDGREFQVTLLERASGLAVLPPAEITFDTPGNSAFLTFASRWIEEHPEFKTSHVKLPSLSPDLLATIEEISAKVFTALGFRDFARWDIRARGGDVFILEANANPGLGDTDDYGMTLSYRAAGMTFADFVWEIVQSSIRRARK